MSLAAIDSDETTGLLVPDDPDDVLRWDETRRRRRILDGVWHRDLRQYLIAVLGIQRAASVGRMSRAINLLRSYCQQVGIQYDQSPTMQIDRDMEADPELTDAFREALDDAAMWAISRRHALYVVGLRECWRFLDWTGERFVLEVVPPDETVAYTAPGDVKDIREVRRARRRRALRGARRWAQVWDCYSLDDPRGFWLEDPDGKDVTTNYIDGAPGWIWLDDNGDRFLPWVLTHAESTGKLWDPFTLCELVDATFDVGVGWNNWHKACRDASWAQKYAIGARLQGGRTTRDDGLGTASHVTTAPDSILMFEATGDGTPGVGAFPVPVSLADYAEAILQFQRTALATADIHPADIASDAGQASSGYAIQLKRSAQRRLARSFEGQFRHADEELVQKAAWLYNRMANAGAVPAEGWDLVYRYPDESADEQTAQLALDQQKVQANLMTPVEFYQAWHPGVDDDDAIQRLLEGAAMKAALSGDAIRQLFASGQEIDAETLMRTGAVVAEKPDMEGADE